MTDISDFNILALADIRYFIMYMINSTYTLEVVNNDYWSRFYKKTIFQSFHFQKKKKKGLLAMSLQLFVKFTSAIFE